MQGEVAVAEDHGVGFGKAAAHAGEAALGRTRVVDQRQPAATELDFQLPWEPMPQRRLVDIALDGEHHWAERSQVRQHRGGEEVAGVDRCLGRANQLEAALRKTAIALRHMGICNDGDQTVSRF